MWPFNTKESVIPTNVIQDSIDDLGLVRLNQLNYAIENAFKKHLDPSQMNDGYADDQSGYFQSEFNLVATAARMKGMYRREPWVYTTTSLIARTLANIPFNVINNETNEVLTDHDLCKLINSGNDLQDNLQLNWSGDLDLVLGGNEFLIIDENDNLVHVPVEYVEFKFAENISENLTAPIEGIHVRQSNSYSSASAMKSLFVPWERVIHFKMPNPFSPFVGMSMISAAARPILLDRHKNEFEMAFYLRGGTNAGVIETTEDITKSRMERLMRTFESAFTGRRNWFRQLFLPKGAKWVNSGLTMAEMEHLEGLRENRLTLLAVLGVPPMKVGISQDVNRATSEVQDKTFYENTIIPLAKMKAAGWNNSYLVKNIYKGAVRVEPNFDGFDEIEGGLLTRAEQAKSLDNIATINEQREIAKLPQLKDTDPRGKMFLVELEQHAMYQYYTNSEEIGPDDNEEIENDNDEQSPEDLVEIEEEKTFAHVKQITLGYQEQLEKIQAREYQKSLQRNLSIKFDQVRAALKTGMNDVKYFLTVNIEIRLEQYLLDGEKLLQSSMSKGFLLAQNNTRTFSSTSKKAFNFSVQDEIAIEEIKERTADGKRKTLEERNIESYFGFDETSTERIQQIIEDGLKDGKTTDVIAKTIETDYGEKYKEQAFTIARTETLTAISQGLQWQNEVLNEVFTEVNKQWFHVGDVASNPEAREEHAEFEKAGVKGVVPSDHVWVNPETGASLRFPRDPQAGAKDTINCRCSMSSVIPATATSKK